MPYGFYYDYYYLVLVVPTLLLALFAQGKIKSAYNRYSHVPTARRMTGAQVARQMLDAHGLSDIQVAVTRGQLTDHYDPTGRVVMLSEGVFNGQSIAAAGIAAHECGHALQHAEEYTPLVVRNGMVKITNIGSRLSVPLILLGLLFSVPFLAELGVILFSLMTIFQLVTLPVEFNASSRALQVLDQGGYLDAQELPGAKKVLRAAALTYLAALLTSVMQLLRLVLITQANRRRRD